MAAQQERAAGAAGSERSAASSLLREIAEVVVLAVILYFGISFAIQAVHVEGLSMFATLDDDDYLIANKIDYRLHAPERGDIIILRPPTNNSTDFIKRIVALPGERLLIRGGFVYINGHLLHEPYLPEAWVTFNNWPSDNPNGEVIPPNQYFVMAGADGAAGGGHDALRGGHASAAELLYDQRHVACPLSLTGRR